MHSWEVNKQIHIKITIALNFDQNLLKSNNNT